MRKAIKIFFSILSVALLLTGCQPYRDLRVISCHPASLSPKGFRSIDVTLKAEVSNPHRELCLSEISGVVRKDGAAFAEFTSPDLTIEKRCTREYEVPLSITLCGGARLTDLLPLIQAQDLNCLTLDIKANAKGALGNKRKINLEGMSLDQLTQYLK